MILNIHAGHGKQDSKSCGAYTELLKESIENRLIKDELILLLKKEGHTVYDCTIDYPNSQSDCINQIIKKCNSNNVDLDISIHFNSGRNDLVGNNKIGGIECLLYSNNSAKPSAERICRNISELGFTNRGIKYNKTLSVLKNTKAPSIIIEICFVDDKDDTTLYKKLGYKLIAKSIAEAILNKNLGDDDMQDTKVKVKINNKYYEINGIFKDNTNFIKVRDLENAGFKISNEGNIAVIETPCCCKK
jgi:N-acetylmuramoyl-L-alanine amidase